MAIANMLWWVTHDGQQYATALNYVPLPQKIVTKDEIKIKSMKCGSRRAIQVPMANNLSSGAGTEVTPALRSGETSTASWKRALCSSRKTVQRAMKGRGNAASKRTGGTRRHTTQPGLGDHAIRQETD